MIGSMSKEDRELLLEKARQSRDEKRKWAEENLRMQYADETHWEGLAREKGVKLPQKHIPNTELKYMKRMIKSLGVDLKGYLEDCGCTTLKQLVKMNPKWSARAECGLLLEYHSEKG